MNVEEAYEARIQAGEIDPDPAQRAALPALGRVLAEAAAPPERGGLFRRARPVPVRGLYLWGGVGRGKSMLMDLAAECAREAGIPTRRVHFHAFMQEVQSELTEQRKRAEADPFAPVAARMAEAQRLLALDEMQVTDIADATIVGRFFERLLKDGVGVITTSNRPPRDLYKDGLNRQLFTPFIDLIEARMEVRELASGTDHRQGRLAGEETWLVPAGTANARRLQEIFAALAGPDPEPLRLRVKGRDVVLPAYGRGAAHARFWDLCGTALGPADYLAVADAVRVLALEGIPRLSRRNYNEAKRFVTLVDALYEARVRLAATAADVPENLYVEGENSFEFERTASRLREMTSEGWGAGPRASSRP